MNCRSCGAVIEWVKTSKGKPMPVERDDEKGNIYVEEGFAFVYADRDAAMEKLEKDGIVTHYNGEPPLYLSHFATCPQAGRWRKK